MMLPFSRKKSEDGSFPMVMLFAIIVGGLIVALVSVVSTGQTKVQHNRAHTAAITGAEAGVQQAMTVISTLDPTDPSTTITSDDLLAAEPDADTQIDEVEFSWTATRLGPNVWELLGTGVADGSSGDDVSRTVKVLAEQQSDFFLAAFADIGFRMLGANGAASYTDTEQDNGNGAIGSNGDITMNGNAYADAIYLMGDGASCTGNGCSSGDLLGVGAYEIEDLRQRVEARVDEACEGKTPVPLSGDDIELIGGQDYCLSSLFTGNHAEITLTNDASIDNPVRLFVQGNIEFGRHGSYNCGTAGCSMVSAPDSAAFQIYSVGTQVRFGNQGELAAAIAAPNANCHGNPSNAQFDIYGSLVCNDLSNQGGWNFYFDERLMGLNAGDWTMGLYSEEFFD